MHIRLLFSVYLIVSMLAGCGRSTDSIIENLKSDDPQVRQRAVTNLRLGRGDSDPVPALISLLGDDDEQVVFIAVQLLGEIGDSTAVTPLTGMLHHTNPHIRAAAAWSLGSLGIDGVEPLFISAFSDSSADVRYSAVYMAGTNGSADAVEPLFAMLRDSVDSVRVVALHSLFVLDEEGFADLSAIDFAISLVDESPRVRYVTAQVLGNMTKDSEIAGSLLMDLLDDENKQVRLEAINGIEKLMYEDAIPRFKELYDYATVDEERAMSAAIKTMTGEDFPPMEP